MKPLLTADEMKEILKDLDPREDRHFTVKVRVTLGPDERTYLTRRKNREQAIASTTEEAFRAPGVNSVEVLEVTEQPVPEDLLKYLVSKELEGRFQRVREWLEDCLLNPLQNLRDREFCISEFMVKSLEKASGEVNSHRLLVGMLPDERYRNSEVSKVWKAWSLEAAKVLEGLMEDLVKSGQMIWSLHKGRVEGWGRRDCIHTNPNWQKVYREQFPEEWTRAKQYCKAFRQAERKLSSKALTKHVRKIVQKVDSWVTKAEVSRMLLRACGYPTEVPSDLARRLLGSERNDKGLLLDWHVGRVIQTLARQTGAERRRRDGVKNGLMEYRFKRGGNQK